MKEEEEIINYLTMQTALMQGWCISESYLSGEDNVLNENVSKLDRVQEKIFIYQEHKNQKINEATEKLLKMLSLMRFNIVSFKHWGTIRYDSESILQKSGWKKNDKKNAMDLLNDLFD